MDVKREKSQIMEIAMRANKEAELGAAFDTVQGNWKRAKFEIEPYKDTFRIASTEEVNALLEESLVSLSNILNARYNDSLKAEVDAFYKKLSHLEEMLEEWLNCQRVYMYLENILKSPDIARNLGTEKMRKFFSVDSSWVEIMK